jgi:hypothetical protein
MSNPENVPWQSSVGPAITTPERRPGSIRRTSSVDIQWPGEIGADLVLHGAGRDLRTGADGATEVLAEATTTVRIVAGDVAELATEPAIDVSDLAAVPAKSFRRHLDRVHAVLTTDGSLLGLLLDEIPVAVLISGAARRLLPKPPGAGFTRMHPPVDVCSGWKADGIKIRAINAGEGMIARLGGPAPSLATDDPLAWHSLSVLTKPGDMRRRRRLDLWVDGDTIRVEGMFRDTLIERDGIDTVVHEYAITATIDRATMTVVSVAPDGRSLPGLDCPAAMASAQRIVGAPLATVRRMVRDEFDGPTTCTHLNDELRALGDLHALSALL